MKAEDLKTKSPDELQKLLMDTKKEQFNLRFQRTQGTLENTANFRKNRRLIARIKTFMKAPASAKATADKPAKTTKKEKKD